MASKAFKVILVFFIENLITLNLEGVLPLIKIISMQTFLTAKYNATIPKDVIGADGYRI